MIKFISADYTGPVCERHCEHESCLVIACPGLFRVAIRDVPARTSE